MVVSSFYLIFAVETKMMIMKSKEYYISLILSHAEELKKNFGVKSLRLFGSVSRNEQKEGSDVDICVDMEPKMFLVVRLKRFLENLLECSAAREFIDCKVTTVSTSLTSCKLCFICKRVNLIYRKHR